MFPTSEDQHSLVFHSFLKLEGFPKLACSLRSIGPWLNLTKVLSVRKARSQNHRVVYFHSVKPPVVLRNGWSTGRNTWHVRGGRVEPDDMASSKKLSSRDCNWLYLKHLVSGAFSSGPVGNKLLRLLSNQLKFNYVVSYISWPKACHEVWVVWTQSLCYCSLADIWVQKCQNVRLGTTWCRWVVFLQGKLKCDW